MRILADENIPLITIMELRSKGFDVKDIRGTPDQGMPDDQLWHMAQKEKSGSGSDRAMLLECKDDRLKMGRFF
jgi:hypothetical protein